MADLSYSDVQHVLTQSQALADAAEAHGTLAGALCSVTDLSLADWLAEILPDGEASGEGGAMLAQLFDATAGTLEARDSAFEPLLPDDDASLELRSTALGEWCHGFLYGLGSGRMPDPGTLRDDIGELMRDLTEITHVTVDPSESPEASEEAYAELVEFVRVGVQILFEELRPLRADPSDSSADTQQAVLH